MSEEQQLREDAKRAERWARSMGDPQLTERLMRLAREYTRRADELLQQQPLPVNRRFTPFPVLRNGGRRSWINIHDQTEPSCSSEPSTRFSSASAVPC